MTHLLLPVLDVLGCADIGIVETLDVVDGEVVMPNVSLLPMSAKSAKTVLVIHVSCDCIGEPVEFVLLSSFSSVVYQFLILLISKLHCERSLSLIQFLS